jgi:hypothetical protein
MTYSIRDTSLIALFGVLAGLCLGLQLVPRPPNVEFTSLFVFVVGLVFGLGVGGLFGGFVMFVNGFFSPWGFAGLNLPFQMAGMILVGLAGGVYRRYVRVQSVGGVCVEAAVLGAVLTVVYDLITNLGTALSIYFGLPLSQAVLTALAYGAPFSAVHVVSNVAVFGLAAFPLVRAVNRVVQVGERVG